MFKIICDCNIEHNYKNQFINCMYCDFAMFIDNEDYVISYYENNNILAIKYLKKLDKYFVLLNYEELNVPLIDFKSTKDIFNYLKKMSKNIEFV